MAPILIALALGVLAGHLNLLPSSHKYIGKFTTLCLIIMLMAMGAQLGANDRLLSDITRLGGQALVLASGSIIGSVILVRIAENHISKQLRHSREEAGKKSAL